MGEELDYVSLGDLGTQQDIRVTTDEANLDTLVSLQKILLNQIDSYSKTSRLDLSEKLFPLKEQLAINVEVAKRLKEVELVVSGAIGKVKEIQNERR